MPNTTYEQLISAMFKACPELESEKKCKYCDGTCYVFFNRNQENCVECRETGYSDFNLEDVLRALDRVGFDDKMLYPADGRTMQYQLQKSNKKIKAMNIYKYSKPLSDQTQEVQEALLKLFQ